MAVRYSRWCQLELSHVSLENARDLVDHEREHRISTSTCPAGGVRREEHVGQFCDRVVWRHRRRVKHVQTS
eukprot:COSAG02_NODE_13805_length_1345_cov_1.299358_3_plen_70_part_01